MTIQEKIQGEIKDAMLAKDTLKLTVVRGLSAAFTTEAMAKSLPKLTDEQALLVIKRAVNQRKDSIEQFTKGGRKDLVKAEAAELKLLETYLPATMSKADIKKVVEKKMTDQGLKGGVAEKAQLGKFMGIIMKELKGKADGADVKEVVEAAFK